MTRSNSFIGRVEDESPIAAFSDYELRHLVAHLEEAGLTADLHLILALETNKHRNAWYEAKAALNDEDGYLDDINRAWRVIGTETSTTCLGSGLDLQCRYALIAGSLTSQATRMSPRLVLHLTERGLLTPIQGLGYARRTVNKSQRVKILTGLLKYFDEPLRSSILREATEIARGIKSGSEQVEALAALAPHLNGPGLRETLGTVRQLISTYQAEALSALAPYLSGSLLSEGVKAAIELDWFRTKAIAAFAPHLDEVLLRHTLAALNQGQDKEGSNARREREGAVAFLVPRLAELGYATEALALARRIEHTETRAKALIGIAVNLNEPSRGEVLEEALDVTRAISWIGPFKARTLLKGLPYATEGLRARLLQETLAEAHAIPYIDDRLETLAFVAPHLSEQMVESILDEALTAALRQQFQNALTFPRILESLTPHLNELGLRKALKAVRDLPAKLGITHPRAEALEYLVPRLAELGHPREALEIASGRDIGYNRHKVLGKIALITNVSLLKDVVSEIKRLSDEQSRAEALAMFAPYLNEPVKSHVLTEATTLLARVEDEVSCVEAIGAMAPHLSDQLLSDVLSVAMDMNDKACYVGAVAKLLPYLRGSKRHEILTDAMSTVVRIEFDFPRSSALLSLAPYLDEPFLAEAFQLAYQIEENVSPLDRFYRGQALAGLLPRLAELGYAEEAFKVISQATRMPTVQTLVLGESRSQPKDTEINVQAILMRWVPEALTRMAPYLNERFLQTVYEFAKQVQHAHTRTGILAGIAPYLDVALLPEILSEVEEMWDGNRERSKTLVRLAPYLDESLLRKALEIASRIEDESSRADALVGLLPRLAKLGHSAEAMSVARKISELNDRVRVLTGLMPHLDEGWLEEAIEETMVAVLTNADCRAQSLTAVVPYLSSLPEVKLRSKLVLILRALSADTRSQVFLGLGALAPLIAPLGGSSVAEETTRAMEDVARWWR